MNNDAFPSISSISNSKNTQQMQTKQTKISQIPVTNKTKKIVDDFLKNASPESISQTDIAPQDFGFALSSAVGQIQDTGFEAETEKEENDDSFPYPKHAMMKLLQPEFFSKYDLDTLFFIFFYLTGTSLQYFAGRELKKRSWVFHKQYQTWFRLVEEPTETKEDYQVGKFEYFDHGSDEGWMIRQRSGFKLEYDMIEKD